MLIERGGALETGAAEPQAVGARRIGGEPFGVNVQDEEDRPVLHIRRDKIVWFPRVDGNNGVFREKPSLIAHINARRRSTDMKNQMPFTMRMHVEGAVQLVDRRADVLVFSPAFNIRGENASLDGVCPGPRRNGARSQMRRTQYFLHSGTVRLGTPILENTAGS